VVLQQHEAQLEQSAAVWQLSQDVSEQPHTWHAEEEYAPMAIEEDLHLTVTLALFP
jgi:hypothetical protein